MEYARFETAIYTEIRLTRITLVKFAKHNTILTYYP